jgi:hypothetical protein
MIKGPLSDRLEYAIFDTVSRASTADHQNDWSGWEASVKLLVPDYSQPPDLLAAFKRLWNGGVLRLTKPDNPTRQRHALDYSGDPADDEKFFFDPSFGFNAVLTDAGRSYWDGVRGEKKSTAVGFPS